jgi:hypothetical protein
MKTILTPHLLGFLIERGYTYCLARTQTDYNGSVKISLTPVKEKPVLDTLPNDFDTYYKITREPMQMACGIEDTQIYVSVGTKNNSQLSSEQNSSVITLIRNN